MPPNHLRELRGPLSSNENAIMQLAPPLISEDALGVGAAACDLLSMSSFIVRCIGFVCSSLPLEFAALGMDSI